MDGLAGRSRRSGWSGNRKYGGEGNGSGYDGERGVVVAIAGRHGESEAVARVVRRLR